MVSVEGKQRGTDEALEHDLFMLTVNELWLYARFNLLRLCGTGSMLYLKPRRLVEVAFVSCDTDKGRYTGQRHWMPAREGVCDVP